MERYSYALFVLKLAGFRTLLLTCAVDDDRHVTYMVDEVNFTPGARSPS
jgi:hypothetical protein